MSELQAAVHRVLAQIDRPLLERQAETVGTLAEGPTEGPTHVALAPEAREALAGVWSLLHALLDEVPVAPKPPPHAVPFADDVPAVYVYRIAAWVYLDVRTRQGEAAARETAEKWVEHVARWDGPAATIDAADSFEDEAEGTRAGTGDAQVRSDAVVELRDGRALDEDEAAALAEDLS